MSGELWSPTTGAPHRVELPGGQHAFVAELTAAQALPIGALPDGPEANYQLVATCLCDEEGARLYEDPASMVGEVAGWPFRVFSALLKACVEVNGLGDEAGN